MADLEAPDPVTPEPVAPPVEAPPEVPADPVEAAAVEMQGDKYVPLSALREAREKAKSFKDKADQFDQTVQYVQSVRPYIDFLQANPDLMTRQTTTHQGPQTVAQEPVDEAAEELARTLDLYTADGKPDVRRAQKLRGIIDATADAKAESRVRPLHESTIRERSQNNYQRALVTKAPNGKSVEPNALAAIWAKTDPNVTATEEGAAAVVALALGLSVLNDKTPAATTTTAPSQPAIVSERPGSRTPNAPTLTALDEKIAGLRGRSADEWSKLTRNHVPGRPFVLED